MYTIYSKHQAQTFKDIHMIQNINIRHFNVQTSTISIIEVPLYLYLIGGYGCRACIGGACIACIARAAYAAASASRDSSSLDTNAGAGGGCTAAGAGGGCTACMEGIGAGGGW